MNAKKLQNTVKPMCKYGDECYQKNPEHHQKFLHPSPKPAKKETLKVTKNGDPKKSPRQSPRKKFAADDSGKPSGVSKKVPHDDTDNVRRLPPRKTSKKKIESNTSQKITKFVKKQDKDGDDNSKQNAVHKDLQCLSPPLTDPSFNIKEKFLVEMPPDFYDFWEFCSDVYKNDPSEAFSDLNLHLVGPYDALSKKISSSDIQGDNILRHYRFYYDPPEFQTVITRDGEDLYHIGYFRDDPSEMPFGLASNSATVGPKLSLVGDNIFAAMNFEMTTILKKCSKTTVNRFSKIQEKLKKFAAEKNYSLELSTEKTRARNKKLVARTFHELGIVVPYDKVRELGYRPLSVTNAKLKQILTKIAKCKTDKEKTRVRVELDEVMTNVQFANDECDYGTGLELGLDLFCFGDSYFHHDILVILKLSYDLLGRSEYGEIIQAHLKRREKSGKVSIQDMED